MYNCGFILINKLRYMNSWGRFFSVVVFNFHHQQECRCKTPQPDSQTVMTLIPTVKINFTDTA